MCRGDELSDPLTAATFLVARGGRPTGFSYPEGQYCDQGYGRTSLLRFRSAGKGSKCHGERADERKRSAAAVS